MASLDSDAAASPDPLLLSARSVPALRAQARALLERIVAQPTREAAGVSLTPSLSLSRPRGRFEHRAVVFGEDRAQLLAGLEALAEGRSAASVVVGRAVAGQDVLVFPGPGSQWPGMALGLLDTSPEFTRRLAECAEALRPYLACPLLDVLRGGPAAPDPDRAGVAEPALWAVMVALADLWRAHGVQPATVVGTSQGEVAAATVIGALTLDDAARLVTAGSRIAASRKEAALLAVAAPLAAVTELLAGAPEAALAVVNGPRSAVVSGPPEVIEVLRAAAAAGGHRAEVLPVRHAWHSPAVDPLREELLEALAPIRPRAASATFVSTVTGLPTDPATLDAEYWFANLRRPVRFDDAVAYTLEHGARRFIECSPRPVLCGSVEENAEHAGHEVVALGTLAQDDGGPQRVRRAMARAWAAGAPCSPIVRR